VRVVITWSDFDFRLPPTAHARVCSGKIGEMATVQLGVPGPLTVPGLATVPLREVTDVPCSVQLLRHRVTERHLRRRVVLEESRDHPKRRELGIVNSKMEDLS